MPIARTSTQVEYPVEEFKSLLKDKIFPGKEVNIEFVIEEVGGHPMVGLRGVDEVTKVRVSFDGTP